MQGGITQIGSSTQLESRQLTPATAIEIVFATWAADLPMLFESYQLPTDFSDEAFL